MPHETVMTTRQLAEKVTDKGHNGRRNWAVSASSAIAGNDTHLPVDPYILGVWLGDGSSWNGRIAQGTTAPCTDAEGLTDQAFMIRQLQGGRLRSRTEAFISI